jgi:DNA-directed RNA polymerase specialized sigma24 family protein
VHQSTGHVDVADSLIAQVAIRNALGRLRSSDRDVLTLVAWEGLDTTELATALGCSKATASLQLHRARRRFAKYLEAEDGIVTHSSTDPTGLSLPSTAKEVR